MTFNINVPDNIIKLCNHLEHNSYPTYVVGGCVRDAIMNKKPKDWDITTAATPEEIMELSYKYNEIHILPMANAINHGVTFIHFNGEQIELATFRKDGKYTGHNCEVNFKNVTIHEDLKRRDFTINAMAYRPYTREFIDDFNGQADIESKIIRCVGDAEQRISEDAVRILRAFRFAARYNFKIQNEVMLAIKNHTTDLVNISKERLRDEFEKILVSPTPGNTIKTLNKLGIMSYIIPEYDALTTCTQNNPYHKFNAEDHTLCAIDSDAHPQAIMRWAELMHDIGKPVCKTHNDINNVDHFYGHPKISAEITEKTLRNLHYDNHDIEQVTTLVQYHDADLKLKTMRKLAGKYGIEWLGMLVALKTYDMLAQSDFSIKQKHETIEQLNSWLCQIIEEKNALTLKDMNLNGRDIMQILGINKNDKDNGPKIGKTLNYCFDLILENPELNNHDVLYDIASTYIQKII